MSSKELDNLVSLGLLKVETPDQSEFAGLLDSGRKRLADARNKSLSRESQFDLAYAAAHAFSLAALRWCGYRPANKRYVVFQALPHTLGLKADVWRVLDKCHAMRNALEYEGAFNVDVQLLKDIDRATGLVAGAVEKLGPVKRERAGGR